MKKFLARVTHALHGWVFFFRNETNGRIQAVVAVLIVMAGAFFRIAAQEWLWLLICIALVIALEMVNTAVETLADHLHPERHPEIKVVKDVAAGAVLWASAVSVVIGAIIFLPKVWSLMY